MCHSRRLGVHSLESHLVMPPLPIQVMLGMRLQKLLKQPSSLVPSSFRPPLWFFRCHPPPYPPISRPRWFFTRSLPALLPYHGFEHHSGSPASPVPSRKCQAEASTPCHPMNKELPGLAHTQGLLPVIPEALRSLRWGGSLKFKTNLSSIVSVSQETGLGMWFTR